jgi:hypothetical protein
MMYLTYQIAQIRCDELIEEAARHRLARRAVSAHRGSRRSSRPRPPRRGIRRLSWAV